MDFWKKTKQNCLLFVASMHRFNNNADDFKTLAQSNMFPYATSTWKPGGLISYVPWQNDKFFMFTSYPAITIKHAADVSSTVY